MIRVFFSELWKKIYDIDEVGYVVKQMGDK